MARNSLYALGVLLLSLLRLSVRTPAARRTALAGAARAAGQGAPQSPAGAGGGESPEQLKNRNDWLRAAYTEAWKQYVHEDTLTLQRNNIFVIIQTALLALFGSLTSALIKSDTLVIGAYTAYTGYFFIGIIACVFSVFAFLLLRNWEGVTDSAQAYVDLRWSTCRRIEEAVGLEDEGVNLAVKEGELKLAIGNAAAPTYSPYGRHSVCAELQNFSIVTKGTIGWGSIKKLIRHLRVFWGAIFSLGLAFMFVACWLTFKSPGKPSSQQVTITGPATIHVTTPTPTPAVVAPGAPPDLVPHGSTDADTR